MKRTLLCLLLAACGGTAKPEPAPSSGDHAEHGEMAMPPDLAKFHDALAPRWHADKGPKRMADTCAAVAGFTTGAETLAKSSPPNGADAGAWSEGSTALVTAVAGLKTTCDGNDATAFELAFAEVHKSFHVMLEALAGKGHEAHPM